MITLAPSPCAEEAARHFAAGVAAIGIDLPLPDCEWHFARDGALTAVIDGQWFAGCSVPRRAAERMLERTSVRGNVVCLLLPVHAQQIAVCLERVGTGVAVIAILADAEALSIALACCDFAADITAGRLHFAWDAGSLDRVFDNNPGLPLPQQFVKLPTAESAASEAAIAWTQQVFSRHTARHGERLNAAKQRPRTSDRIVLAAPQSFRLWDDAGHALAAALGGADVIDTDRPATSAVAFVAERAADAAALITVDSGRADSPAMVAAGRPWLTFATKARLPAFVPTSPRDGLLLAHESQHAAALAAGWPADRIVMAGWPAGEALPPAGAGAPIALIADVTDLQPTAEVEDFSSHRLVWEACREELLRDPAALGDDPTAYLHRVRKRHDVPADDFPVGVFLERLLEPAVAIGTARRLIREGMPLAIHGRGWELFEDLLPHCRGAITSRDSFDAALSEAAALIDPFINRPGHPARFTSREVIRTVGRPISRVVQDCRAAIARRRVTAPVHQTMRAAIQELLS